VHPPRRFDDPDREDDGPEDQLEDMFDRVQKALLTWTECLDLLTGPKLAGPPPRAR